MPGLPIASLGQTQGMPAPASLDALESDRRMRAQSQGTPLVEMAPVPQGQGQAPSPETSDPITLAEWQGKQAVSQLSAFDQQIAGVKAPVQHELDTSFKQYQVDIDTIRNSGMEQDQQRQRLGQLNATYQKKWISIKSKIEPQTRALEQQKQAAQQEITLRQALRMKEIQTYAKAEEEGLMDHATSMMLQYRAVGYDVPATTFRPSATQTPYKTVQAMQGTLKALKARLDSFKTDTYNPPGWGKSQRKRPALYVKSPGSTGSLTTDWELAGEDQQAVYANLLTQYTGAQEALDAAASQLVGKRVANLSGNASNLANGVRAARPRQPQGSNSDKVLTNAEIDALLDEVNGDETKARALAASRNQRF